MNPSDSMSIPVLTKVQKKLQKNLQKEHERQLKAAGPCADYVTGKCAKKTLWVRTEKVDGCLYKDHVVLTKNQSCLNLPPGYAQLIVSEGNSINQTEIDKALQQGPVTVWVLRFATPAGWWVFATWKNGESQDSFGDPKYFTDKVIDKDKVTGKIIDDDDDKDDKRYFLNDYLDKRYGCWGKLLDENKKQLGDVVYNQYPYSVNDDFSWHCGDAEASVNASESTLPDTADVARTPCSVCGWVHDEDLTKWINPKSESKFYTVIAQTDRHKFLVYLHDGMEKNSGDVSLSMFMEKHREDGKDCKDILGPLITVLFQSTCRDRGKIRSPDLTRSPGRPKKKK